ncbi:MAG: glycoside hydrolase family 2 protein [Ignavibacteria bacterium]
MNGEWEFTIDPGNKYTVETMEDVKWKTAKVPLSWQAQFEDLRDYQGIAWYRKKFSFPLIELRKVALLKFNAVDYLAEVFINRKSIGKHEGGYTPFQFDITKFIKEGENEVIVRVMDPVNDEKGTEGISYWNIPHGKQSWYVQTSGIWQDVNIFIKPELYIQSLHITASMDGAFQIDLKLNNSKLKENNLRIRIAGRDNKVVWSKEIQILSYQNNIHLDGNIENPSLWSFSSPYLYEIEAEIGDDKITDKFGFRSIEAKNRKLYLNGEPFYLIGALDQDFYPETIYTIPSEVYIREEMLKAKQLGLNTLRCHIKVPDPVYLKTADELGLLIWYEIPNWDVFSSDAAARASKTIDEMLERDWNHPALVILSLINESWGINLKIKEQREWLLNEFIRVKEKAAGRLVVDNSACYGNFHLKSDLNDYHTYWSIPDNKEKFDETINEFSKRPKWLFSEFGDSKETGQEPLLLSEFGNWGLPKLSDLPWWMERKFYDVEVSLPLGYEKRFFDYQYKEIFDSYNELAEESQKSQFNALKYEIETIRMKPEIQGYVITEFTDIDWECNGLLDMRRNFKNYSDVLPFIQQQDVIIPMPAKYNYYDNEEAEIKIFISYYSSEDLDKSKLLWKSGDKDSGFINLPAIKRGDAGERQALKFALKKVQASEKLRIEFKLVNNGKIIARNFTEIFIYPSNKEISKRTIKIYDPRKKLNEFAEALKDEYELSENSSLIITNTLDAEIINKLSNGSNVICIVDSSTSVPGSAGIKIISRNSEWYDGNWASNVNWKRNEEPVFSNISFGKTLGFETALSSPECVIGGIPKENFSDVLAGMYVGWIHLNSAYILKMKHEKGRLIMCSFPIAQNYSSDPFAHYLFRNLVDYIGSGKFKSNFNFN